MSNSRLKVSCTVAHPLFGQGQHGDDFNEKCMELSMMPMKQLNEMSDLNSTMSACSQTATLPLGEHE